FPCRNWANRAPHTCDALRAWQELTAWRGAHGTPRVAGRNLLGNYRVDDRHRPVGASESDVAPARELVPEPVEGLAVRRTPRGCAAPPHVDIDAAHDVRQPESLALFGEVHLSVGHLAEVTLEARQLALGVFLELGLEAVRAVVQDDLHSLSIPAVRSVSSASPACIQEAAGRAP